MKVITFLVFSLIISAISAQDYDYLQKGIQENLLRKVLSAIPTPITTQVSGARTGIAEELRFVILPIFSRPIPSIEKTAKANKVIGFITEKTDQNRGFLRKEKWRKVII